MTYFRQWTGSVAAEEGKVLQELQACKGQERIEAEDKCRLVCRRNRNGKGGAINDDSYWKGACLVSFYWLTFGW